MFGYHNQAVIGGLDKFINMTGCDDCEEILQAIYAKHLICHLVRPFHLILLHTVKDLQRCLVEEPMSLCILALDDLSEPSQDDWRNLINKQIDILHLAIR